MAGRVRRGDVWLYEFQTPDKRRPVVVLTRDSVIPFLHSLMVAPVSSAPRGIDSEVLVGIEEGLKRASAVNLDNVQTVRKDRLKKHLGRLDRAKMIEVCEALDLATGCDAPGR